MTDGYAGRFAVEAAFLILLAVGLGVADERPLTIVGVMAAGWVVVSLIELLAWLSSRPAPPAAPRPEPVEQLHGWDVAEIIAPQAPEQPVEAELTTVMPSAAEDEADETRRRWFGRRR
jgi:hypothetical protein